MRDRNRIFDEYFSENVNSIRFLPNSIELKMWKCTFTHEKMSIILIRRSWDMVFEEHKIDSFSNTIVLYLYPSFDHTVFFFIYLIVIFGFTLSFSLSLYVFPSFLLIRCFSSWHECSIYVLCIDSKWKQLRSICFISILCCVHSNDIEINMWPEEMGPNETNNIITWIILWTVLFAQTIFFLITCFHYSEKNSLEI